jgi:hypothetical protein
MGRRGPWRAVRATCGAGRLLGARLKTSEVFKSSGVCGGIRGGPIAGAPAGTRRQGLQRHDRRGQPSHRFHQKCVGPGHRCPTGSRDGNTSARSTPRSCPTFGPYINRMAPHSGKQRQFSTALPHPGGSGTYEKEGCARPGQTRVGGLSPRTSEVLKTSEVCSVAALAR